MVNNLFFIIIIHNLYNIIYM